MFKINDKIQSVSSCRQTASIIVWNQQVHWIPWCHHWQISCCCLFLLLFFFILFLDNWIIYPQQRFQLIKRITWLHLYLMSRAREMNYRYAITFNVLFYQTKSIRLSNLFLQQRLFHIYRSDIRGVEVKGRI